MSARNCCKDCKKRKAGCHAECEDYEKFVRENEKIRRERSKDVVSRSLNFMPKYYK